MKPCRKCNGQGYWLEQPLSMKAVYALAQALPDEPASVVEHRCDCGNPDTRGQQERAQAWANLMRKRR